MVSLSDGEKISKIMFIRFDVIHERDRRTDRQTDGHCMTAKTALASHRAVKMNDKSKEETMSRPPICNKSENSRPTAVYSGTVLYGIALVL